MFFPQLPYFLGDNDNDDGDDDDDDSDDDDDYYNGNDFFNYRHLAASSFFGFFVNYLFVHHFVVYLLIQSTVLPFLLSYDFISLNFKTRPKITSLVCLVFAARKECIRPWIDDPAQQGH